jgi:hypothetical protein
MIFWGNRDFFCHRRIKKRLREPMKVLRAAKSKGEAYRRHSFMTTQL